MDTTTAEIVEQLFTGYLKENKLRRTPERYAILSAVYSIEGCFDIDTLHKHLEENEKFRVSKATVYNTIALLMKADLVIHHQFGGESLYEKCYGGEKCYTICSKCHKVEEGKNIKISENIATNIKSFYPVHFSLYIYGLCSKCNRTQKRRKQKKA